MECATTSLSQQVHDREVTLELNRTRTPTRQVLLYCYKKQKAFEVILLREQHTELTVVSFFDDENNRPKDELVSGQSGRGETNNVEATGMKNDRACAKFEMRRKCDGEFCEVCSF